MRSFVSVQHPHQPQHNDVLLSLCCPNDGFSLRGSTERHEEETCAGFLLGNECRTAHLSENDAYFGGMCTGDEFNDDLTTTPMCCEEDVVTVEESGVSDKITTVTGVHIHMAVQSKRIRKKSSLRYYKPIPPILNLGNTSSKYLLLSELEETTLVKWNTLGDVNTCNLDGTCNPATWIGE